MVTTMKTSNHAPNAHGKLTIWYW